MEKEPIIKFIEKKYAAFEDACNKEASPFLLLQLANANENAHTRILKYLLSIHHDKNQYYILDSFLDCFDLPKRASDNDPTISDQEVAIGNKGTGFIDLYIGYKDEGGQPIQVILENKIKGAGDTDKQLARYIATIAGIKTTEEFKTWYGSWNDSKLRHIYVLYLTREGGSPAGESLPEKLKEALGDQYIECNYMDNLSEWFDNILPTLPIGVNHSISTGMHQYMLYLESLRNPMKNIDFSLVSELRKEYSDQEISDQKIYEEIGEYIKIKDKNNQNATWIAYLEEERENIYALDFIDMAGFADWRLHVTPSFIILYKKSWADLDTRKYVIPSLNLCLSMDYFQATKPSTIIWKLQVDHVQPDALIREKSEKMPDKLYCALKEALGKDGKGSNHGKTMLMEEITQDIREKSYFASDRETRQGMYEELLNDSKSLIETIDKVVKDLSNPTTSKDN